MYKDLSPIKNSDLSFIILTFEKPPAALQPINCMCYTSCKHACTFERMATQVNTQRHLRLPLLYLGAQWLFKARPSVQYRWSPNIFRPIDLFLWVALKDTSRAKIKLLPCDSRLLTPVPHIPLAPLLDWVSPCIDWNKTKWYNSCMPAQRNRANCLWCLLTVCVYLHDKS